VSEPPSRAPKPTLPARLARGHQQRWPPDAHVVRSTPCAAHPSSSPLQRLWRHDHLPICQHHQLWC
jgi:hypothetical protein